jgi:hypothetical protein
MHPAPCLFATSLLRIAARPEPAEQERFPEWLDGEFRQAHATAAYGGTARGPALARIPASQPPTHRSATFLWQVAVRVAATSYGAASSPTSPSVISTCGSCNTCWPSRHAWCRDKASSRQAMARELPNQILRRRKTPVAGQPGFRAGEILWTSRRPVVAPELIVNVRSIG